MLDFVRKHAKSWVVKVFLWLIVIVFIGWGGYAYQTRHESDVARVGEHYISDCRVHNRLTTTWSRESANSSGGRCPMISCAL